MMRIVVLVDANLLLYAVDQRSPFNPAASQWLTSVLNGDRRVGFPWTSLGAFMRIITHPRVTSDPLTGAAAWSHVESWLRADPAWVPPATERTAAVLGTLVKAQPISGPLMSDAMLAALAIENGLKVMSADSDFARFAQVDWVNPLA